MNRGPGVSCYRTLDPESILHSLAADDNFVYAKVRCHKSLRLVIYVVFQMKYIIKLEDFLCCQNNLKLHSHITVIFRHVAWIYSSNKVDLLQNYFVPLDDMNKITSYETGNYLWMNSHIKASSNTFRWIHIYIKHCLLVFVFLCLNDFSVSCIGFA